LHFAALVWGGIGGSQNRAELKLVIGTHGWNFVNARSRAAWSCSE